ncbi:unnamed protein product [Calypogeia fissa]
MLRNTSINRKGLKHPPEWYSESGDPSHHHESLQTNTHSFSEGDEVYLYIQGQEVAHGTVYSVQPDKVIYSGRALGNDRIYVQLTKVMDVTAIELPYSSPSAKTVLDAFVDGKIVMWDKSDAFHAGSSSISHQEMSTRTLGVAISGHPMTSAFARGAGTSSRVNYKEAESEEEDEDEEEDSDAEYEHGEENEEYDQEDSDDSDGAI